MEMVQDLMSSCDIAVGTLNDLLNYDKIESGLMTLDFNSVSALPFLRKSVQPFYIQARHAQVSLSLGTDICESNDHDLESIVMKADESKLSQVIRNLVSNAIKFTPKNGTVLVNAMVVKGGTRKSFSNGMVNPDDSSVTWLRVEIVDSGAGISKENLPRVFREIIQFSPGRLQQGAGSGLGLWISKAIVDLHGGHISVHSEGEGHGCTFTVELPVESVHTDDVSIPSREREVSAVEIPLNQPRPILPANKVSPAASTSVTQLSGVRHSHGSSDPESSRGMSSSILLEVDRNTEPTVRSEVRLLVVDDAAVNLKIMCRGLKSLGYTQIEQAEDGAQAVSVLRTAQENEQTPHVVLMDYQMPVMDGPTAAKTMREMGYRGRIYGVTGNALKIDIDFFLSHGADRVFTKPISITEIDNVIKGNNTNN
eukprot:CAMPEP_0182437806 /NCGR_PEP_ID=MMETSP1167-20130531/85297_1 /TAXON_ID=2988 /ORGANISM="Mallomonas Sp, Strain CCMP3275" /LENGTH=423 /DNA_ID=CAMNT_0024630857 /DNA_START=992 /DNA_END=2263 /DNA_ORIENTATION=-